MSPVMIGSRLSHPNPVSTIYSLLRHPYVGRERLVAFQQNRLRLLVEHAYRNVTHYRRLFDRHGLKPCDIRTVDDLCAVPITSRNELQALPVEEIVSRQMEPAGLISRSSSGSSGRPFTARRTWWEERVHGVLRLRALHALGLRATDKHCYVMWLRSHQRQDHQIIQRTLAAFGIARRTLLNGMQSPEDIVRALHQLRPTVVSGYPGVLVRIAQTVSHQKLRSLQLRLVCTGGEVLTPLMRQQIQEGFATPVYDTYGSIEFNLLAWECKQTGEYHSSDDGMIMEVLRDGTPVAEGGRGEVVGTDLHSFAMPLIRYRLGDVATKGSETCRCGQPFSTIRSIQGRTIDYFVLPGNRLLHPYEFGITEIGVTKAQWIRSFQMTQQRMDSIVMRVVPFREPSTREVADVVQPIEKLLGPDVHLQLDLVPEIPTDPNGKFRVYRSFVQPAYDELDAQERTVESRGVGEHV